MNKEQPDKPQSQQPTIYRIDGKTFWVAIIIIVLIFGWAFVRPAYYKHKCDGHARNVARIDGSPDNYYYESYKVSYSACLHHYGF